MMIVVWWGRWLILLMIDDVSVWWLILMMVGVWWLTMNDEFSSRCYYSKLSIFGWESNNANLYQFWVIGPVVGQKRANQRDPLKGGSKAPLTPLQGFPKPKKREFCQRLWVCQVVFFTFFVPILPDYHPVIHRKKTRVVWLQKDQKTLVVTSTGYRQDF